MPQHTRTERLKHAGGTQAMAGAQIAKKHNSKQTCPQSVGMVKRLAPTNRSERFLEARPSQTYFLGASGLTSALAAGAAAAAAAGLASALGAAAAAGLASAALGAAAAAGLVSAFMSAFASGLAAMAGLASLAAGL